MKKEEQHNQYNKEIIERIKKKAKRLNYNQSYIAEKIGVTRSTVSTWFSRRNMPTIYHYNQLIKLLGLWTEMRDLIYRYPLKKTHKPKR
jgi:transcriptional regulator with XRE-family HTH domain